MHPHAPVPAVHARVWRRLEMVVVGMLVLMQGGPAAPAPKPVRRGRGGVVVGVVARVVRVGVVRRRAVAVVVGVGVWRRARVVVGREAVAGVWRRGAVGVRGAVGGGGRGWAHGCLQAHGDHAPRHVGVVGPALDGDDAVLWCVVLCLRWWTYERAGRSFLSICWSSPTSLSSTSQNSIALHPRTGSASRGQTLRAWRWSRARPFAAGSP